MSNALHVPTMAEMMAAGETPEILFWVGCAGSFDDHDRRKKTRNAAKKQLTNTIVNFKSKHQELNLKNTAAVIAFLPKLEPSYSQG